LTDQERYRTALLDWLACASAGAAEPAARAAREAGDGLLERVTAAGAAGHVLDYDDTYLPGLAHLSAPVAPAALLLAVELGLDVAAVLAAYCAGFEATGALARAGHPALYERGWHPTAVCGTVGSAVAGARLLALDPAQTDSACAIALVRAGGLRASFGSDAKALQVGMAAAAGVHAARLAASGGSAPLETVASAAGGYEAAFGAPWAGPDSEPAVRQNWIKAYPCCLATHSGIEAADELRRRGGAGDRRLTVIVSPRARQAAMRDDVANGLEAKFSIPYVVAFTLLHGPPLVRDFATVDAAARALAAEAVTVEVDDRLAEMQTRIAVEGEVVANVERALGSPERPLDGAQLASKLRELGGDHLAGTLEEGSMAAADVVAAAGLDPR